MIALNQASCLRRAIASCESVVDEVIVVDTGSTDGTPDVARSLGARVIPHLWQHSFAEARNTSLAAASHEWVFVLDCDETLAPECCENLRRLPASSDADSYVATRIEQGCGAGGAMLFVRLGRPAGRRFIGRIHETIVPAFNKTEPSGITIYHHSDSLLPNPEKHRRYLDLLERQITETPDQNYYLTNLAHTYLASGDPRGILVMQKAVATLDRTAEKAPHALAFVLLDAVLRQSSKQTTLGMSIPEAEILAQRWFADCPPLLSLRARIALAAGDYRRCIELGQHALELWASGTQQLAIAYPADAVQGDVHLNLGVAYAGLGQLEASLAAFEQAQRFPTTAAAALQNIKHVRSAMAVPAGHSTHVTGK